MSIFGSRLQHDITEVLDKLWALPEGQRAPVLASLHARGLQDDVVMSLLTLPSFALEKVEEKNLHKSRVYHDIIPLFESLPEGALRSGQFRMQRGHGLIPGAKGSLRVAPVASSTPVVDCARFDFRGFDTQAGTDDFFKVTFLGEDGSNVVVFLSERSVLAPGRMFTVSFALGGQRYTLGSSIDVFVYLNIA